MCALPPCRSLKNALVVAKIASTEVITAAEVVTSKATSVVISATVIVTVVTLNGLG